MNIQDAIKMRTLDAPYITRELWNDEESIWGKSRIKIMPTNTPDCCTIESVASRGPRRGWQPTAEDLIADDWITVG
ncbi:MW1434 family type I TA system toxin [Ruthenibacterium lactatiformans]|uniref:Thoeris anti-defense Tad2 family protein n=1 Tax=Ruthenibacterium lactatiformans TaxID=1550024 RepID=UPI0026750A8D|nr:MW1434 family type I TA system toxin [Ruthenibacterium lactatiformans]